MPETPTAAAALACQRVVRIYSSVTGETHALRGVDAAFAAGSTTAVTGPSGSGKSSLLAVLAVRERPNGGEVLVAGTDVAGLGRRRLARLRRRDLAWVPQRPTHSLFGHLTAAEDLAVVAGQRGLSARREAVAQALDAVGLGHRARVRVAVLSGGEQQRLAVAAACLGTPSVVVADEPSAELDDASADLVAQALAACAAAGSAVVVATHDARLVRRCDRVLALRHGVLSSERRSGSVDLATIDPAGRLQLPPEALALFPDHRAVVRVEDGVVRLDRPPADDPGTAPDDGGAL